MKDNFKYYILVMFIISIILGFVSIFGFVELWNKMLQNGGLKNIIDTIWYGKS